jgi:hypothetical protein
MQSLSELHEVLQAPVPQTYGEQLDVTAAGQVPDPVQLAAAVYVDPVQDAVRHDVEDDAWVQAPLPLHVPVLPQVPFAAQPPRGSLPPAATLAQVPRLPAMLQAWHVPQVAVPQQTPSMQLPLVHWLALVQVAPLASLAWQVPPVPVQ